MRYFGQWNDCPCIVNRTYYELLYIRQNQNLWHFIIIRGLLVKSEPDWAKNGDYYWSWWGIVSIKACYDLHLIWLINFTQSLTYSLSKMWARLALREEKGVQRHLLRPSPLTWKLVLKALHIIYKQAFFLWSI